MNKTKLFNTDSFMKSLYRWLVRDFRSTLDDPSFLVEDESLLSDIPQFRLKESNSYFLSPYTYFKCRYQMDNLFKRYTFENDLYTPDELEIRTTEKFYETQSRIGNGFTPKYRTFLVLQEARKICKDILGQYDIEEHYRACRFAKNATVGCPRTSAYLDSRLSLPLTGSLEHIRWFKRYLQTDTILSEALSESHKGTPKYQKCDELTLVNVPKSFKSLRSIMPNTTLGSFYSYGLGRVIQNRLSKVGLNIRWLQQRHRRLVLKFSKTRSHVTADLSAASDSFTWQLINWILPRQWCNLLNYGRIRKVKVGDKSIYLSSFMTMGIGFTFQAETLLFYCILKGIQKLAKMKGLVSVYGDDLIYPTRMHHFVQTIFTDINFQLNNDKTFVKEEFRESCGSDSYCGFEVRPFQPEGTASLLSSTKYTVLLYKTINGLKRRWDENMIRQTLRWLYSELLRVNDVIYQVPPSFPDFSGVHVLAPCADFLLPWATVRYNENLSFCFRYLSLQPRDRFVENQHFYYWLKLQSNFKVESFDWDHLLSESNLRWIKAKVQPRHYRSVITRKRLIKLAPVVPTKIGSVKIVSQTGTIPNWC